jgi:hypothetical protein
MPMCKVINAFTATKLESARAELPEKAAKLAAQVDDAHQCVLLCPAPLFGSLTTNGVEVRQRACARCTCTLWVGACVRLVTAVT